MQIASAFIARRLLTVALALSASRLTLAQQPTTNPDSIRAVGERRLDSLLRANSYELEMSDGRLGGAGLEFLTRHLDSVQFVALGERHGVKEIPLLALAMLRLLHDQYGFAHLATENGSQALRLATRGDARHARDSIAAFARRYPNAFEFSFDQDLELVTVADSMLRTRGEGVWGLDQEFGALHILDQLPRAPSAARPLFDSLLPVVRAAESRRFDHGGKHWMGTDSRPELFRALAAAYHAAPASATAEMLNALEISARVYQNYRFAVAGQPTGYDSNNEREEFMKRNFMRYYRAATARGEKLPRVMLKMGSAHLGRGQSPFSPYTMGNLLSEFAIANGQHSFHIMLLPHNTSADTTLPGIWNWSAMVPLARVAPPDRMTLIDMRPLRAYAHSRRLGTLGEDLRRTIFAYDAVVLIGGARDATETLVNASP